MGDLFMSLIHTCELNGANPFDNLTKLQRHAEELKRAPARNGCRGTTARLWSDWRHRWPRNMMNAAWPKRIDGGQR
jgi:hypothetical protein